MANRILSGPRAKVSIADPITGATKVVGIFSSCSYDKPLEAQVAYILGRMGPADIAYTAADAVTINCNGYRVVDHGAHIEAGFPTIQEMLEFSGISISVLDRQSGKTVLAATSCFPTRESGGFTQRALSELSVSYIGLRADDESSVNAERSDSTQLP